MWLLILPSFLPMACSPAEHMEEDSGIVDADPLMNGEDLGDLRPAAQLVLERLSLGQRPPDLDELRDLGLAPPEPMSPYDFTPPATIRVWRMSQGGASSCDGPVEVLDFTEYVKGVLPREWITSWEDESLRTGAVAIRTYAAWWVNAGGKYTCADICDTTSCQVYDDGRLSVTNAAVDDTEGDYAVQGTSLIFAQYSAENGDPTADGVSDPYCAGETVFGHGHGVCQWGTQRWALYGGKEHHWMIEHYYPGGHIVVVGGDADGDGYGESDGDCDDADPTVNPGADEHCDGRDDDCDGAIDEPSAVDAPTWYLDADGDGYGDAANPTRACTLPAGYSSNDQDCDDTTSRAHPGAVELCDSIDDDCDGAVDEGFDQDADGWLTCEGDCDDGDPARNPGAPEVQDWIDNDCDWRVDEGTVVHDDDGDGWSEVQGDCDDLQASRYPGAPEIPNGLDDDCDGSIDETTAVGDDDGDGRTEAQGDCDDADADRHPGAVERPDGIDDDCDGLVDEGTVRVDDDGDGWTETDGDCDDADRLACPGCPESADGRDNDCDGSIDDGTRAGDDDGDGWSENDGDCDDDDATTWPGAPEAPDGRDNDCDGLTDDRTDIFDDDGDGWTDREGDCDDADAATWPGAAELPDGRDNDCDGFPDEGTLIRDDDGDGWTETQGDCDDGSPAIHPAATETRNGLDDDCDGLDDEDTPVSDDDHDGFSEEEGDCDDANRQVRPGAPELTNGVDDDCDGIVERPEGWRLACAASPHGGVWALPMAILLWPRRRRPQAGPAIRGRTAP